MSDFPACITVAVEDRLDQCEYIRIDLAEQRVDALKQRISELESINTDLVEALEDAAALIKNMIGDLDLDFICYYSEHKAVIKQNEAALAKARGEEQPR